MNEIKSRIRRPRIEHERPARLRRIAELIDEQAEASTSPAQARELARDMRVRAAELEAGDDDQVGQAYREIAENPGVGQ